MLGCCRCMYVLDLTKDEVGQLLAMATLVAVAVVSLQFHATTARLASPPPGVAVGHAAAAGMKPVLPTEARSLLCTQCMLCCRASSAAAEGGDPHPGQRLLPRGRRPRRR